MTTTTIRTRTVGPLEFTCRDSGGYVRVSGNGWDRKQICDRGAFMGPTIEATGDALPRVARQWWRQYRDWIRRND